ncbi:MAG: Tol-Pal system beta propeller repeat protein TolB [Steroidobacteraceae bacterium]
MLKRWMFCAFLALAVLAQAARAELTIVITKGNDEAIPIAVVPFGWNGVGPVPFDVAQITSADLARSGRFKPMERGDMVSVPQRGDQIQFEDWRLLKADFIVVGRLVPGGADGFAVEFEIYNVLTGQRLYGDRIVAVTATLRAAGHRVADIVFEKLTGVRGAFSTRIAYVSVDGRPPKQSYQLIVADADGANVHVVAQGAEPLMSPAWSPDGARLAYVSFESRQAAIYVQELRTGVRTRVSAWSGVNGAPAWSPDGTKLALALSRRDGNLDIYVLTLATQNLVRVTDDAAIDTEPAWSSDGQSIYFTSDRAGGPQIYKAAVTAGAKVKRMTFDSSYNARPRVAPDEREIAYVTLDNGGYRIGALDLKSGGSRILTNGALDESPSYAPNGVMLIYASQERGRGVLAIVSTDGKVKETLAADQGEVREPVWGPYSN